MSCMVHTYQLYVLIASLAGWMNSRQAAVVENDDQRRRLAAKGKRLGRRLLMQVATTVTPDTILRWHRRLIAAKWAYESKRVGWLGLMKRIRELMKLASSPPAKMARSPTLVAPRRARATERADGLTLHVSVAES